MAKDVTKKLLVFAVAAVPLAMANSAWAQYRNTNDGRALDANNRVGSGGYNTAKEYRSAAPNGNDIVTGNVTGLRYFHGRVDYTDPQAFRGNLSGSRTSDFLTRTTGNTPSVDNPNATYNPQGRLFYGESRGVAPPTNSVQIAPGVPGYIPSPQIQPRTVGDQRLGDISHGNVVDRPEADQLVLQGPLNQQGQQTSIVGSPLLGIRPTTTDEQFFLSGMSNFDRRPGMALDDATIQRMRAEIAGNMVPQNDQQQQNQDPNAARQNRPGALNNGQLNAQGTTDQLQNQALDSQIQTAPGAQTDQGLRQRLNVPPEKQSEQYREMLRKYNQLEQERKLSAEEAAKAFNDLQRAAKQPNAQVTPGAPGAGAAQPGATPVPGAGAATTNRPAGQPGAAPPPQQAPGTAVKPGAQPVPREVKKPEPVKVPSLSKGMQGKGLTDIMKQAEDLMRQGKYNAALDKYDAAQQVAPNNPLVPLGRSIAELGGSFYARAETHIKDAFTQNPALMVGQYDLRGLLGEERLGALVKDLRALADKEKRDPRPVFLLAFIAYNTDQPQAAEGYLDIADKRAGGRDPFFKQLKNTWALPEKPAEQAPATQPNK